MPAGAVVKEIQGECQRGPSHARRRSVPETRLELVNPCGWRILSPLRIPFRHSGSGSKIPHVASAWQVSKPRAALDLARPPPDSERALVQRVNILGISAFYHDSAACLVQDGRIVAAAQEERFTRKKHDAAFPEPRHRLLPARGRHPARASSTSVAFYDKPLLKFERLLQTYLAYCAGAASSSFLRGMPLWLKQKLHIAARDRSRPRRRLQGAVRLRRAPRVARRQRLLPVAVRRRRDPDAGRRRRVGHGQHRASGRGNKHRAAARAALPAFARPAVLGVHLLHRLPGQQRRVQAHGARALRRAASTRDTILKELLDLKDGRLVPPGHGVLRLLQRRRDDVARDGRRCSAGRRASPRAPLTQREMDLAASIQAVTEEIVLRIARHAHASTGSSNLVLAGGVALNCVANGRCCARVRSKTSGFSPPRATPAARSAPRSSSGTSCSTTRGRPPTSDAQRGSFLGPATPTTRSRSSSTGAGARLTRYDERRRTLRRRRRAARRRRTSSGCAGAHGVRSARARQPLDPRRRARARRCSR